MAAAADRPALVKRSVPHPADPITEDEKPAANTNGGGEVDVLLAVRIPAGLRRRYRQAALDADRPMRQLVIEALEEYLSKQASKPTS